MKIQVRDESQIDVDNRAKLFNMVINFVLEGVCFISKIIIIFIFFQKELLGFEFKYSRRVVIRGILRFKI